MINFVSEDVINKRNGGAIFSLTYSSRPINAREKRIGIHEINKCVDLMIMVVFQKVNVEITHYKTSFLFLSDGVKGCFKLRNEIFIINIIGFVN